MPLRHQQRRDLGKGMDVIGPAMEQQDRRATARPHVDITDIDHTGVDLADRSQRRRAGAGSRSSESPASRPAGHQRRCHGGGDANEIPAGRVGNILTHHILPSMG